MKKRVVVGAVLVAGGSCLVLKGIHQLQNSNIVFQMKPEEIKLPPKVFQELSKYAFAILPYSGFCEITGCTHEIHANNPEGYSKAMSEHLSTH